MGLLQTRSVRIGCRSTKEMRSRRSEYPPVPVSLGYGPYGRSSFRLGRTVSAEGAAGRSKFPGCSECQGSLGQDFERPKIVISPGFQGMLPSYVSQAARSWIQTYTLTSVDIRMSRWLISSRVN